MLEKRVPTNPRYAHIQPKVKSGVSMKDAVILSDKIIARRRNEIFDRISARGLLALLNEDKIDQESVYNVNSETPVISVVVPCDAQVPAVSAIQKFPVYDFRVICDVPSLPDVVQYSVARLLRDDVSVELWRAKDRRLFVFAADDKTTSAATTLLVQKGWTQAVAVSGGFDELMKVIGNSSTPSTAPNAVLKSKPSAR